MYKSFAAELAAAEKANGDVHKQMAFIKAANALRAHPTKVASGKEAQQLKGIGPKIALIVQEIIDTGGLRQLSAARDADHERALTELSSVFGLGAASIKALMDDHRVTSLVALRQFAQQRPDDVAPAVHMGIKYHTDFMQPIPRAECDALVEAVTDRVRANVDARFEVTVCGAHRRGAAESSDVDLVVTHPDASNDADEHARGDSKLAQWFEAIVDCLKTGGLVCDTISSSAATFVGVCALPPPKPAVPAMSVGAPATAEAGSAPAPKKRFSIPKMADADSVARESGPANILFRAGMCIRSNRWYDLGTSLRDVCTLLT